MSEFDEARRNCKTNVMHAIGTSLDYKNTPFGVVQEYNNKKFRIYRKSETEYEYWNTNNTSLWKNCNVVVVVKENGDMFLNVSKKSDAPHFHRHKNSDGIRHWNHVQIYLPFKTNPFD